MYGTSLTQHYPAGVSATIDVHEFASPKDILQRSCQPFAKLPAYSNMGTSISIEELRRLQLHLLDTGTDSVTIDAQITGLKFFFDIH